MEKVDIVYVVASKLGSVGMGITSLKALEGIDKSGLKYKAFSRGYIENVPLNKKNLTNYNYLEYLTYPFRFIEKFLKIKINSFKIVNNLFGRIVEKNLPKTKIYHTWMGISSEAVKKAKKDGAILVLEAANSHPLNISKILNIEYDKYDMKEYKIEMNKIQQESKIYREFDYIMCPSNFVYESFIKEGFDKKRLIKMPYGVDTKNFSQKKYKEKEKIKFIFVGSIQLRKGIQYLLQAWEELKLENTELIIVGRIWPDAQKIVKKYSNLNNVKFEGFIKPEEALKNADVFISPSLEEGSALTCYEAMACGLPVIATYSSGSIVLDKKEGFIINSRDVGALKEKIIYFYKNPKQIKKMGEKARKHVENFSWEEYGKRLSAFYKNLIK